MTHKKGSTSSHYNRDLVTSIYLPSVLEDKVDMCYLSIFIYSQRLHAVVSVPAQHQTADQFKSIKVAQKLNLMPLKWNHTRAFFSSPS